MTTSSLNDLFDDVQEGLNAAIKFVALGQKVGEQSSINMYHFGLSMILVSIAKRLEFTDSDELNIAVQRCTSALGLSSSEIPKYLQEKDRLDENPSNNR